MFPDKPRHARELDWLSGWACRGPFEDSLELSGWHHAAVEHEAQCAGMAFAMQ
jgi:hypothetical protein